MEIDLENLGLIKEIKKDIEQIKCQLNCSSSKRWYSVREAAEHLGFSKDKIYKMLDTVFIEDQHFFRRENKILMDVHALDDWVVNGNQKEKPDVKNIIDKILASSA